ncbi:radical SAM protein [Paenibacillus aquistagni]|uniref:Radical SAM superfamily enzyme, MoaA/NifB/PqqE/SkfB family n=1 Tax=Paenibacillus aquistagni TaxID=1852522 RepID=A0A1X7LQ48_9BACL|nr:radical SAM protein [Paenibacillus aquistagni]SMG55433.1 Radical SAM superfamily enzyme, MoaA/NifB/PqqE/SkfB family [Paenibacillus aquistagni]
MSFHYLSEVSDRQRELLKQHLKRRLHERESKTGLSIVYDLTYMCNQACPGCCVSAVAYKKGREITIDQHGSDLPNIVSVLEKIKQYLDTKPGLDFFIDFGGGELTLRPDWKEILRIACDMFGRDSVGMNTNGTRAAIEDMLDIDPYVSYIGISIDGMEQYHNKWRRTVEGGNSFERSMNLIREMLQVPTLKSKLDITTVPTKNNLAEIPALMRYLNQEGIQNYSVHRAMQVGRFWDKDQLLPSPSDYFKLLVQIVETNQELGMNVHLHHSIESIYTSLLLGVNTYSESNLGNPDRKASLGIDPVGRIFFDPWCTVDPWDKLAKSSLLDDDVTFESILKEHGGIQDIIDSYCRKDIRCKGCDAACSGGNRIAAAANHIRSNFQLKSKEVTKEQLLEAMDSVDPACPLYIDSSTYISAADHAELSMIQAQFASIQVPEPAVVR